MTQLPKAAQSPVLRTSDAAVSGLYSVQLYYFRLTLSDRKQESQPHILFAMTILMNIAHRAFGEEDTGATNYSSPPSSWLALKPRSNSRGVDIARMSRMRFRAALNEIVSKTEWGVGFLWPALDKPWNDIQHRDYRLIGD